MSSQILNSAKRVLFEQRAALDGRDPAVVHLPSSATLDLHRAIALSAATSVKQIIAVSNEGLDPEAFEHVVWREYARSGCECKRIYMLPHTGFASHVMERQLSCDRESGIQSRCVIVSRIPFDSQLVNTVSLWVLDGSAVVSARDDSRLGGRGAIQWTVSTREAEVKTAALSWEQAWSLAYCNQTEEKTLDLEEPLVLTADLLNGVAPVLCTGDHVDQSGCDWYHGTWQYLRLLQMVSTPTWHHDFYRKELASALHTCGDSPNTLITGTADYSMLAYLAESAKQNKTNARLHVLDQCATPLFACRWYAKRNHIELVAHEDDVIQFSHRNARMFDLICTDAFLTRFDRSATQAVLAAWSELLKPGARLVTTIRIHEKSLTARDPETAIKDFRERAMKRARRWEPFLRKSSVEIGELAEVYARSMRSNPIGDEIEIKSLLETAGFEIVTSQVGEVPGELFPTVYLRVACVRKIQEQTGIR
jgi:hypothetical protein